MIVITPEIYRTVAARLREEIATAEWFNGVIEGTALPSGDDAVAPATPAVPGDAAPFEWRLTLTAIIRRRDELLPEGPRRPVSDVVPVWWEFAAFPPDDAPGNSGDCAGPVGAGPVPDSRQKRQCLNDFSFGELKPYLVDHD